MGRGRAKAKQTRVARKLKYSSPDTDFDSLQKELSTRYHPDDEFLSESHEEETYSESDQQGRPNP